MLLRQHCVTVVIVNWNGYRDSAECLGSLESLCFPGYLRIVVVDNGSDDGSADLLDRQFPSAKIIRLPKNLGFSRANNIGMIEALQTGSDFVLVLNNDTIVDRHFLTPLVAAAAENRRLGILSGTIYYHSDPRRIWYAGGRLRRWWPGAAYDWRGKIDTGSVGAATRGIRAVGFVTGAVMLIRREVLLEVGLFSPRYFYGVEDMDYCRRARQAGYELAYVPGSRVWHKVGTSSPKGLAIAYIATRSNAVYIRRWFPSWSRLFYRWLYRCYVYYGLGLRRQTLYHVRDWVAYWRVVRCALGDAITKDTFEEDDIKLAVAMATAHSEP